MNESVRARSHIFATSLNMRQDQRERNPQKRHSKIIVIASPQMKQELAILISTCKQFVGAILYCFKSEQLGLLDQIDNEEYKQGDHLQGKFKISRNIEDIKLWLDTNFGCATESKQFANFVLLKQQVQKSTALSNTMFAMLNQNVSAEVKSKLIDQLLSVVYKLKKFHRKLVFGYQDLKQALTQLKSQGISPQKIVNMYTSQKLKIFVVLNNFLMAMDSPTQIYYIQPIFENLFRAVKNFGNQTESKRQIICYRGGLVSSEQFNKMNESVGEVAQNLGFLSVSLNQKMAEQFQKNILYKIQVTGLDEYDQQYASGFAEVYPYSEFVSEYQVLFNPLNNFKILETKVRQQLGYSSQFYIVLRYGSILSNEEQPQKKQTIKALFDMHSRRMAQVDDQSFVLFETRNIEQFKLAKIYFQFCRNKAIKLKIQQSQVIPVTQIGKTEHEPTIFSQQQDELMAYLLLLIKIGFAYQKFGKYQQALEFHEKVQRKRVNLNNRNQQLLFNINNIGTDLFKLGRYKEAISMYERCMNQTKSNISQRNHQYLGYLQNMGTVLIQMRRYYDALIYLDKSCKIRKQIFGEKDLAYLQGLNNLGVVYFKLNQHQKALETHQLCERAYRYLLGESHPLYLSSLNNIGASLHQLAKYEEAFRSHKMCQNKIKQVLGETHPEYSMCLNNMAVNLWKLDRLEEAMLYYTKSLALTKKTLGQKHPNYILYLKNMVNLLSHLGRYNEAFQYQKLRQNSIKQARGQKDLQYVLCLSDTSAMLFNFKRYQESLMLQLQCEKMAKDILGENSLNFFGLLYNQAVVLLKLSRNKEALLVQERCVNISRNILGENSHEYLTSLNHLGTNLLNLGRYNESFRQYWKYLVKASKILGERHPEYLSVLNNAGIALKNLGQNQLALKHFEAFGRRAKNVFGQNNKFYLKFFKNMGQVLQKLGKFEEALRSYRYYKKKMSSSGPDKQLKGRIQKLKKRIQQSKKGKRRKQEQQTFLIFV